MDSEPFLEHVSWEYVLKAITWARKYGLRINLDLHAGEYFYQIVAKRS